MVSRLGLFERGIDVVVLAEFDRHDANSTLRVLSGVQILRRTFRVLARREFDRLKFDHTLLQV